MLRLHELLGRIVERVNVNLRSWDFDVWPYIPTTAPLDNLPDCAFYGLSYHHPLHLRFARSALAGSYFLDRCVVESSVVYKSDVRGDELKRQNEVIEMDGEVITMDENEEIRIKDSFLAKTLVHNYSHDPSSPEEFTIQNSAAMPYSNIHGSPIMGVFLGAGATIDLTRVVDSIIGEFVYLQAGEIANHVMRPGQIWISSGGAFDFSYRYKQDVLEKYINHKPGRPPAGIIPDFVEERRPDLEMVFGALQKKGVMAPKGASLSPYSVVKGSCLLDKNVFVSQRAYLENAALGPGANAQENCFIVNSRLKGFNVTAHGGKILNAELEEKAFVGFNSFLRGAPGSLLRIGRESIVMPHTIIDLEEPLEIPPRTLVWGFLQGPDDLEENSIPLAELAQVEGTLCRGRMTFQGLGEAFVNAFTRRIDHILEANGAFFDGVNGKGHAQASQNISFNIIQPYPEGHFLGMYPAIDIRP
ncbi:MAG: transferase [Pseudomonadota bacterium]